ncbi:MAG: hypothetical protein AMJ53_08840 [Gammaproteobacteria bacterium SG8_11]|nr:MAG: hypothetical protein AMJ53_08840 [Gammaproteobacteria bacterium SG8_11]
MNKLSILSLLVFLMSACTSPPKINYPKVQEEEKPEGIGALLYFSIKEPGTDSYNSRVFVNNDVMVVKDSRAEQDFMLFDRKTRTIYNVNSEAKTIFVIKPRAVEIQPPIAIEYSEASQPSGAIPKVQDMQATHYRYDANGAHCYDAVTMPEKFLPVVNEAMKDFRLVLAGEHASTLGNIPEDMHDACDMAVNIFHATKHYEHGLPIREWDRKGYQRFLRDYKTGVSMNPKEYELPQDYTQFSVSGD